MRRIEQLPMMFLFLALVGVTFGAMLRFIPMPFAGYMIVTGFVGAFVTMAISMVHEFIKG